jgi:hypothetical protein
MRLVLDDFGDNVRLSFLPEFVSSITIECEDGEIHASTPGPTAAITPIC